MTGGLDANVIESVGEIYERLRPIRFVGICGCGRRAAGPATPRNINRRHEFARGGSTNRCRLINGKNESTRLQK